MTTHTAVTLLVVVAGLLLALWLWWTAHRLDRMHHRIELARTSLDVQLQRRSGAVLELTAFGAAGALDQASALILHDAAHEARAAGPDSMEAAESALSEALRAVLAGPDSVAALRAEPDVAAVLDDLAHDCRKVELARRFHNDVVVSARALRARRRVRWLRLAGRAAELQTVDLDDVPPPALVAD
jgi:hypothetical protein